MGRIKPNTIVTALRVAQEDGDCALCGDPASTPPLAIVPLCRKHSAALVWLFASGFGEPDSKPTL